MTLPGVMGSMGWRPDPPKMAGDKPDWDAAPLLGEEPIPQAGTARPHILSILNQTNIGTCVANVGSQAIRADLHRQGIEHPPLPSRLFGNYMACLKAGFRDFDQGTFLRALFGAYDQLGFPPESIWPYRPYEIYEAGAERFRCQPSTEAIQAAFDQRRPLAYRRITAVGYERVDAVKRAIAQGRTVAMGSLIDDRWERYDGSTVLDVADYRRVIGGHAILLAEYEGDEIRGPNSWDVDWGAHGWFRLTADFIAHPNASDFWVVESAPQFGQESAR